MSGESSKRIKAIPWLLTLGACLLGLVLRLVFLDSDAYSRLSWSSALLTDEGFYIHNARNLVLFGTERTDEFNNMLLMPTLHAIQVLVFRLFGVGAVQARLISVVMSILALVIFFDALRRAFGFRVAGFGTLFLGLDHTYLLYNRMALMDTPATLFLIGAFWAFVKSQEAVNRASANVSHQSNGADRRLERRLLLLCGILLLLSYATRGLSAIVILAPFMALWRPKTDYRTFCSDIFPLFFGICVSLLLYLCLWYIPHHAELARTGRYYITHQLLPHSLSQFAQNLFLNTLGDARGMASFLFRHTPALFAISLIWIAGWGTGSAKRPASVEYGIETPSSLYDNSSARYLMWWLLLCWIFFACVNYNPSRYYVLFLPAMAGLTAFAIAHLSAIWEHPRKVHGSSMLLAVFLCYHFLSALLPLSAAWSKPWFFAFCGVVSAAVVLLFKQNFLVLFVKWQQGNPSRLAGAAFALWAVINTFWFTDWLSSLTYKQRDADRWLSENLPRDSVLIGAVAPGLCLNNRFQAVCVIQDLCNDDYPVERIADKPRYILLLDENKWKERWWAANYPELLTPDRRVHAFRGLLRSQFVIGVYEVPREFGNSGRISDSDLPGYPDA